MFEDLRTDRLLIRQARPEDVDAMVDRRNDPEVAHLQAWTLPFTRETAQEHLANAAATDGPVDGRWWIATVLLADTDTDTDPGADTDSGADTDQIVGEIVVHPTHGARMAEVGYTFARRFWGQGYALEALTAVSDWLFTNLPVTRLHAGLHPDNRASAMLLERTGFLFEGHPRLSFWLGDDNSDDWLYGMTRADWEAWRTRPRARPDQVELVEIDPGNAHEVRALRSHHSQRAFVDPVVDSFADALYPEPFEGAAPVPFLRAVRADGVLVGFVMLAEPTPHHPDPYLWRLLIDRMHQRRGIGERVLALVAEQCRSWGAESLLVSWRDGRGSPASFYLAHGFVPTGRIIDGEIEARLTLSAP